jgi:hypothetical protein
MFSDYLRDLAVRCRQYGRDCFDLRAAERFRTLADELRDKAGEIDLSDRSQPMQQQQAKASTKEG